MRVLRSPAFWVILASGCMAVFANLGGERQLSSNSIMASERPPLSKMAKDESILREGTSLVDVKGRFRRQGDRFQFMEEGSTKSIKCLENLSLQRVDASQQDDERKVIWLVTAKVTEFKGENFLALEKAVRTR